MQGIFEFAPITEDRVGGVLTISPTGIPSTEMLGSTSVLAPDIKLTAFDANVTLRQDGTDTLGPAVWKTTCVTSDGTIHQIYRRPQSLVHAYSSDGGDTWTRQTVLMSVMTGAASFFWDLDTDGSKLHLIYHEPGQPSLPGTSHVKRIETVGFTWQAPTTIQALVSGSARRVGVWVFGTDRHYTWAYNKSIAGADPANNEIRYAKNAGSVEVVRQVARTTEEVRDPAVIVDIDGNPWAFWYVIDFSGADIDRYDYAKRTTSWPAQATLASATNTGDGFFYGGLSLMPLGSSGVMAAYDKSDIFGISSGRSYVRRYNGAAWDGEGAPIVSPGDGNGGQVWPSLYSGVDRVAYLGQISQHEGVDRRRVAWTVFEALKSTSDEHYAAADTGVSSILSSGASLTRAFRMSPKGSTATHMVGTLLEDSAAGRKIWLLLIPKDY